MPSGWLDEAGYPRGADGVRFKTEFLVDSQRGDVGYRELIAGYWKEIGVEAEIKVVDTATITAVVGAGEHEGLWTIATGADYPNLDSVFGGIRQTSNFPGGVVDPKYYAMYDEMMAASANVDEQRRLAKALDMYAIEQHAFIWGPRVPAFAVTQPMDRRLQRRDAARHLRMDRALRAHMDR